MMMQDWDTLAADSGASFEYDYLAVCHVDDTLAAYTAELGDDRLTVYFDIDYERETVRSFICLERDDRDYLTTRTWDWPTIDAALPRRFWPADIHHTAKGEHPQLAEFARQAREVAEEHFTAIRAEEALYADDDD